jgi:phage terminase large subunit GpA-like protein
MLVCEVCGHTNTRCFEVRLGGKTHSFDSFECAIHALAPICAHCTCRIVGHALEVNGRTYCSAHCASERQEKKQEIRSFALRTARPTR